MTQASPRIPLAGVIGSPVAHSRSPRLFAHWLRKHGLPGHYVPIDMASDRLPDLLRSLPELGFVGVNVTIPYKERVMEIADLAPRRQPGTGLRAYPVRSYDCLVGERQLREWLRNNPFDP